MAPGKAPKKSVRTPTRSAPHSKGSTGEYESCSHNALNDFDVGQRRTGDDTTQDARLTEVEKHRLVKALQFRIDVPIYGVGLLRRCLEDADWIVDVAYDSFMTDYWTLNDPAPTPSYTAPPPAIDMAAITFHAPTLEEKGTSGSFVAIRKLPKKIQGIPVIIHTNREEQRREIVRLLRDIVNIGRDQNNRIELSISEAILSLLLENWDVEATAQRWGQPDIIRWQLHHNFDRLRFSTTNQVEKDERIAKMVILTGRDDWYSIQKFLEQGGHDFVIGVFHWYKLGIPVVKATGWDDPAMRYAGRRLAFDGEPLSPMPTAADIKPMNVSGDDWPFPVVTFRPTGPQPADTLAQLPKVLKSKESKRKPGFLFDPDEEAPVLGAVAPSKFIVDYIQDGKYRVNGFEWDNNYFRPKLAESDTNKRSDPEFNFSHRPHISHLGGWRRQNQARITQTLKRKRGQPFCPEETDYIHELCEGILQKQLAANPSKTREELLPLRFVGGSAETMEEDFNKKFEGTRPGGCKEPRRQRCGLSLRIKASRDPNISKTFRLRPSERDKAEAELRGDETLEDVTEDSTLISADTLNVQTKTTNQTAAEVEPQIEDDRKWLQRQLEQANHKGDVESARAVQVTIAAGKAPRDHGQWMIGVEGGAKTASEPPVLVIGGGRQTLKKQTAGILDDEDIDWEPEDFSD